MIRTSIILLQGFGHAKIIRQDFIKPEKRLKPERFLKEINVVDVTQNGLTVCGHDGLICTKGKTGIEAACLYDDGGPLMETKNGKTAVIGITR